jgi:hypothetical protein
MLWDQAGTFVTRLCLLGPLLYVGLSMAIDPKGFVTFLEMLSHTLRNFEHRFYGPDWRERFQQPDVVRVSPKARIAMRFIGIVLAVFSLVALVGTGSVTGI